MKKATIYDVAREAGVSLATVSRVINGSSVVREKTKEKVMKVIDELNFKPNQIARGLATNKTTTIAVIFPQSLFAHVKDMIGGIGDAGRTLDLILQSIQQMILEMDQWMMLWKKLFVQEQMASFYLTMIKFLNKLSLLKNIVFLLLLLECK